MPVQLRLSLDEFEGPLELLLLGIEQRKLPITRVSLAAVADQYLAQVRALPQLDPDLLADFLSIGAKLLLLKSRALLAADEPDPVAEETAGDLEERLATYRIFRAAAEALQRLERRDERTYPATREPLAGAAPAPLEPIVPEALLAALRRLHAAAAAPVREMVPARRASVDERRALILDALRAGCRVAFSEVAGSTVDEVIATFLALLELFRRGLVRLQQASTYGDLVISASPP